MQRFIIWFVAIVSLVATGLYVFNPSGTASLDPRARIVGYLTYRIPSAAMQPTLRPGDHILTSTYAYTNSDPALGDVITFRYPPNPKQTYVMRIIGLPGDTIEVRGHQVDRNGKTMQESYTQHTANRETTGSWSVPASMYFVLGDNRDNSADSRLWGFVPRGLIEGKATYVWLSEQENTGAIGTRVSE